MGKPKFVVVEDQPDHLAKLTTGLAKTGKASLSLLVDGDFDPTTALTITNASRVRVVFSDLHLLGPQAATNANAHFGFIASIIDNSEPGGGGPWLLVMWTENVEEAAGLFDYLRGSLPARKLPVAVVPLSKDQYLLAAEQLPAAIDNLLAQHPSVRALLDWEDAIADAAADTISTLSDAAREHEEQAHVPNGIGRLLGFIADASFGQRAPRDQFGAVATGLSPLVADRVTNADRGQATADIWRAAIVAPGNPPLSAAIRARLNSMLHIDARDAASLQPCHIGTVSAVPATWLREDRFRSMFGPLGDMMAHFRIAAGQAQDINWGIIGFRAPCDDAHGRTGPLPFALAVEGLNSRWFGGATGDRLNNGITLPEAIWRSPQYIRNGQQCRLLVSALYVHYLPETRARRLAPLFRIRDQLLAELTSKLHAHGARPAILSF